jgi:DNA invertase Pin-like site-specific DNA recombinase
VNYRSFTEAYLDSLGPFGDVIVSMLATIAAQDLIKTSKNTKAARAKRKQQAWSPAARASGYCPDPPFEGG